MVFITQGPRPPRSPTRGHPTRGRAQRAKVPRMPGWYTHAQSFPASAMLTQPHTRIVPATCPLKGWHSHDQPIDQIGPSLATRLSELRAKVVCFNHQDPVIRFTGRSSRQTSCLLRSPLTTCRRRPPTYSNPGRKGEAYCQLTKHMLKNLKTYCSHEWMTKLKRSFKILCKKI